MANKSGSKRSSKSSSSKGSGGSRQGASSQDPMPNNDPEAGVSTFKKERSAVDIGISTAPTALSSPGGNSANGHSVITIDHNVNNNRGRDGARSAGLILGLSKPVFLMMSGSFLLLSGGLAFFLTGWLEIPGLNSQIERLEAEVTRLADQVDRLEAENDRYESLNDSLNMTVQDFGNLNGQLNMTTGRLDVVNQELNATNYELSQRIDALVDQNEEYASLNTQLNASRVELEGQVDRFHTAIASLILENTALTGVSDELSNVLDSLGDNAQDQNVTLAALELALGEIVSENDRLEDLNSDLTTVVSFLDETSSGLTDSIQQATELLADQITTNRMLVLGSLENTYRQRISNWDCDYRDVFREMDYGNDFNAEIPESAVSDVVLYVTTRVLQELCLSEADFSQYLRETYPSGLTSNRLVTAVTDYTSRALDWYFPEGEEDGVTPGDWASAGYECENLQDRFFVVQ